MELNTMSTVITILVGIFVLFGGIYTMIRVSISPLERDVKDLKTDIGKVQDTVNSLDKRVSKVEDKVDNLDKKIDKLETKVDNLDREVINLKNKVDNLDRKVDNLDNRVGSLENKVDKLDSRLASCEVQLNEIKNKNPLEDLLGAGIGITQGRLSIQQQQIRAMLEPVDNTKETQKLANTKNNKE
jgi:chromosome segregation ATPase